MSRSNAFLWSGIKGYRKQSVTFKLLNGTVFVLLPVFLVSIVLPSMRDSITMIEQCENISLAFGTLLNILKIYWFCYQQEEISVILIDFKELVNKMALNHRSRK